ncbi:MAG: hypothetical protein ACJATI_000197 [Halioglobus sp.]|jgi:hypothetical protein
MTKKLTSSYLKKTIRLVTSTFLMMSLVVILSNCDSSPKEISANFVADTNSGIDYTKSTPPPDVPSQSQTASSTELAQFAWQEFIALNWPAVSNGRGAPDTNQKNGFISASQLGSSTYTPVWQTYWHRNELFPATDSVPVVPSIKDTTPPRYQYTNSYPYGGAGNGDYTLWNNLDEINELGEDAVFAHSIAVTSHPYTSGVDSTYQVLYEAKMNFDGSNYINEYGLNIDSTRSTLKAQTVAAISANGVCGADPTQYICLPCGDLSSGIEGNIEIKSAWRKLTSDEANSNKYHIQNVIYYHNTPIPGSSKLQQSYYTDTMGLVGLHIIHKTKTFPNFVYATWEHVDNLDVDTTTNKRLVYTEIENTSDFGDKAQTVHNILRTHPIPNSISSVNDMVEQYLNSQHSVWQYYKLINVQAKPMDVSSVDTTSLDSIIDPSNSSFYLSNSVIESNKELQTFTGTTASPDPNNNIVNGKEPKINMGGCMGCHGNAQALGTDFNFLIAKAPFSFPEFTGPIEPGCPDGAETKSITSWSDVKDFFNNCVVQTSIGASPHGVWWDHYSADEDNYCFFTTGTLRVYGNDYKVCDPGPGGDTSSMIVKILEGHASPPGQMPAGGPFFTIDQINELGTWINNGCPFGSGSTTPENCSYTPDPPEYK